LAEILKPGAEIGAHLSDTLKSEANIGMGINESGGAEGDRQKNQ